MQLALHPLHDILHTNFLNSPRHRPPKLHFAPRKCFFKKNKNGPKGQLDDLSEHFCFLKVKGQWSENSRQEFSENTKAMERELPSAIGGTKLLKGQRTSTPGSLHP